MPTINISRSKSWISKQQCILPKILHWERKADKHNLKAQRREKISLGDRINKWELVKNKTQYSRKPLRWIRGNSVHAFNNPKGKVLSFNWNTQPGYLA